eukprot:351168-Chlamydomonas_euryale.AAC.2
MSEAAVAASGQPGGELESAAKRAGRRRIARFIGRSGSAAPCPWCVPPCSSGSGCCCCCCMRDGTCRGCAAACVRASLTFGRRRVLWR